MTGKQYHTEFYAEVLESQYDEFQAWLHKKHAVLTKRTLQEGVNKVILQTEPVYQYNIKRSLSTFLRVPFTTLTFRVSKRADIPPDERQLMVTTPETVDPIIVDDIDALGVDELRAALRAARHAAKQTQDLQTQIDALASLVTRSQLTPSVTVGSNNTTINNITLNNFGEEDLSYLESPDKYLRMRKAGLVLVIEHIHFHADHPANANVRLKSLKHQLAEVNVAGDWQVASLRSTEDRMINKAHAYIARGIDPSNVDDATLQWMRDARTRDVTSHVREDVKSLLVNQRKR